MTGCPDSVTPSASVNRRLLVVLIAVAICWGLAGAGSIAVAAEETVVINSFEAEDEVQQWTQPKAAMGDWDRFKHHQGTGAYWSTERATEGKHSCRMDFSDLSFYPSIFREIGDEDWSGYASLELDVYNPEDTPQRFSVIINRITWAHTLRPKSANHLTCDLTGRNEQERESLQKVTRFWFWVRPPAEGVKTFFVDNIYLVTPDGRGKEVARRTERMKADFREKQAYLEGFFERSREELEGRLEGAGLPEGVGEGLRAEVAKAQRELASSRRSIEQFASLDASDTLAEMLVAAGGTILDMELAAQRVALWRSGGMEAEYAVTAETSLAKVLRDRRLPGEVRQRVEIAAARNEYEPFQIVVIPFWKDLEGVRLQFSDLVCEAQQSRIGKENISENVVAYLEPPLYERQGTYNWIYQPSWTWPRLDPYPRDGWPDILLNRKACDVEKGRIQPLWVTVFVPEGTAPGVYEGKATVRAANARSSELEVSLRVWDFTLPEETHLRTWANPRIPTLGKVDPRPMEEIRDDVARNFAAHRMSPYMAPECYPFPKYRDTGTDVEVDFTEFDKTATFLLDELKMNFIRFPVKLGYGIGYKYSMLGEPPFAEEKKRVFVQYMRKVAAHLREKGWLDEARFCLGETREAAQEVTELIREADPEIEIFSFRLRSVPYFKDGAVDIWAAVETNGFVLRKARERLAKGEEVWWYNGGDAINYSGAHNRAMFWMNWKYDITGFVYWTIGGWNSVREVLEEPVPSGVVWGVIGTASEEFGDGNLIWPDIDNENKGLCNSMRWELWREGLEDYEYHWLLDQRIKELEARKSAQDAALIEEAKGVLGSCDDFVTTETYYHQHITAEQIFAARGRLAAEIEKLSKALGER